MALNVGIDVGDQKVTLSMTSKSLTATNSMSPATARLIADQLIASADNIEKYCDAIQEPIKEEKE